MTHEGSIGRFAAALERGLGRVARLAHRRPGSMLGVLGLLTALSVVGASHLKLDADVTALLPDTFESIKDLKVLEERFGGVGFLIVAAWNTDEAKLQQFADDIAPRLRKLEWVRYVDHRRPNQFFIDHAFYYAKTEHLEEGLNRLQRRIKWEKRRKNPMYVDLEDDAPPPPLEFQDLVDGYDGGESHGLVAKGLGETHFHSAPLNMIAIIVKPAELASDLDNNRKLVAQVEDVVRGMDLASYGPELQWGLTGRYKKRVDQQDQVMSDLTFCTLLALVLMVFYLSLHFRRLAAVVFVSVPLLMAVAWTLGATRLVFGQMNILTGFAGAILLGLGIDHGIHLLGRYETERSEHEAGESLVRTFAMTGRAVTIAALTTLAAFVALSFSEFRAFHEFGAVAALGIFFATAAYTTVLPALIGLFERLGWRPRRLAFGRTSWWAERVGRHGGQILVASALVIAAVAWRIPDARFDYDFKALEGVDLPSFRLDYKVSRILGYDEMPVVVLTQDDVTERAVVAAVRKRRDELGEESEVDLVASAADLTPRDQQAKVRVLRKAMKLLEKVKKKWLPEEFRDELDQVKKMVAQAPFTRDDLPLEIKRQFQAEDAHGRQGYVLVFPKGPTTDGEKNRKLAKELRNVPLPGGAAFSASGEAMIMADVLNLIHKEAPPILGWTMLAVILVLWLLLGHLGDVLLCLVPAGTTMVLLLALMPFAGVDLNYLNIIFLLVLFGAAVDGGVHIVTRVREGSTLEMTVGDTGRAVTGSILTTIFGFGTMGLADHEGLSSVGHLMALGLGANLLATLVVLPALIGLLRRYAAYARSR